MVGKRIVLVAPRKQSSDNVPPSNATHANPLTGERDLQLMQVGEGVRAEEPTFGVGMLSEAAGEIQGGDTVVLTQPSAPSASQIVSARLRRIPNRRDRAEDLQRCPADAAPIFSWCCQARTPSVTRS